MVTQTADDDVQDRDRPDSIFTDAFLQALATWQRGWLRDPFKRKPIADALEREAARLPHCFRLSKGPVFRKRHIYRTDDQRELAPLFLTGELDEGSATSWTTDRSLVATFGDDVSFQHADVVAGAIFQHRPTADEVVLDVTALWREPRFLAAVEDFRRRGGTNADALCNFADRQAEIVVRAPLRLDEIVGLSRPGNFDSLATAAGAFTTAERARLGTALHQAAIDLQVPVELDPAQVERIIGSVTRRIRAKVGFWNAIHAPLELPRTHPRGSRQRFRLADLIELAKVKASPEAILDSWSRLPTRDGLMVARWSDGTAGYKDRRGRIWLGA